MEIEHAKKCYRDEMYILALPYFKKAAKAAEQGNADAKRLLDGMESMASCRTVLSQTGLP